MPPTEPKTTSYQQFICNFLPIAVPEVERLARRLALDWDLPVADAERLEHSFSRTLLGTDSGNGDALLRRLHASFGTVPDPIAVRRWAASYFGPERAGRRIHDIAIERRSERSIDAVRDPGTDPRPRIELEDGGGTMDDRLAREAADRRRAERTARRDLFAKLDADLEAEARTRGEARLDQLVGELAARRPLDAQALRDRQRGVSYAEAAARDLGCKPSARDINRYNVRFLRAWERLTPTQRAAIAAACPPPDRNPRKGRGRRRSESGVNH